jgi:hypothetical protein
VTERPLIGLGRPPTCPSPRERSASQVGVSCRPRSGQLRVSSPATMPKVRGIWTACAVPPCNRGQGHGGGGRKQSTALSA